MLPDVTDPAHAHVTDTDPSETTDLQALRVRLAAALDLPEQDLRDDDNLIALGLDSIALMQLAAHWRRAGAPVTFGELAATPTLAAWHALLTQRAAAAPQMADPTPPGTANSIEENHASGHPEPDGSRPFPLALMQHAYWAGRSPGQRLGGVAAHFYHEFDGTGVDPDRLETAVRAVLARHGMLRVRILDDGTQQLLETAPWPGLRVTDLREATEEETADELARLRRELSHRRLDIASGEVFDVRLTLLPGGRTRTHVNLDMIAADALSLRVLLADLATAYEADDPGPLPALDYSFPRYLADREAHRAGPGSAELEADRAWWHKRLPDLPGPPELPAADYSTDQATTVVRRHRTLTRRQLAAFAARARCHGLTPAMALTAVFAETLTAWSAEPSLLLNLPLFDREPLHRDVPALVGDFTSSVLLAWDGTAPGGFADRARRLQERFHDDAAHARYSGVEVLRDLTRQHGEQTLAPVVHTSALGLGPLFPETVRRCFGEPVWVISQGPQVWLDAQVTEVHDGLLVNWDAREAAFAPGVLDAMFTAYSALLDRLLADKDAWTAPVGELVPSRGLLTRERVNDTGPPPGAGARLHDAFFTRAAADPDAPALLWGDDTDDGSCSYGQLADRALTVAGHLRSRGVAPGDLVAIALPKGPDQVVAVLATLACGAAYLPVAADQPAARRERVLQAAGARLVLDDLTAAEQAEPLPGPVAGSPDDLAYVLYTSGSTGEPKGVEVPHAAAMCTLAGLTERFGLGPADRTLALSALEFDLSVFDVFAPLLTGGAVVCVREEERRDADAWLRLLHHHRATVLNCVPALADMLLTAAEGTPPAQSTAAHGLPARKPRLPLRTVLLGGDRVTVDLPRRLTALAPGCRCAGLGGTTETAIHSTVQEAGPLPLPPHWDLVPYGVPLRGVVCRVVDALGRDCPDWVPGELWIGGGGVARGYRGDPERTADRFVEYAGRRWYRTGDRARYRTDGTLDFLGRADHQVKIRGHRVELGEIEAALTTHPDIDRAAAVLLPSGRLGAAAAPWTAAVQRAGLRAHLERVLPSVMVPDTLAVVPALPLTPNGKTDRAAVTAILEDRTTAGPESASAPHDPPRTPAERLLATAWQDVLGAPAPGRSDDFFALGGDSLLATRLLARLRADGVSGAALSALFAHPKLDDFAETLRLGTAHPPLPVLTPDPDQQGLPFPPTDVQAAYWLGRSEQFTLGGAGCHFYREYDIPGLDLARLESAVNRLVQRHGMLRAVFDEAGNQRVLPDVPHFSIPVTEAGDDPEPAFAQLRDTWSHHVFDPGQWPLFSLAAVRDGNRVRLAIGVDNLVLDALSILTFYAELSALYEDLDTPLPPLDVTFRDYLLAAAPDPADRAAAEKYWETRLDTLPAAPQLPLATDPGQVHPRFTRRTATLDADRWRTLEEQARAHGVTPSVVLLTAYCEVLAHWSTDRDLTVNLTLFDRQDLHRQLPRVMGDFTSLVLVGHHPEPGEPWLTGARRTQHELWQALDHRSMSAVQVLRRLAQRTGAADVTVPVVFTSALGLAAGDDPGALFTDQVYGVTQTPQVWLDHQAVERNGPDGRCVDLHWDAVDELFPAGMLDAMFETYIAHLHALLDGDWRSSHPIALPPAQRAVRDLVNDTTQTQRAPLLHAPFFERAAERPEAPAVITDGETPVSYGELSLRARRVAALLAAHGVAPGELVAVSMPKGADQIAAVLGVLAAGAAYLPVGVDQPAVRRERILARAGVRLALTDSVTGPDWPVHRIDAREADRHAPVHEPAVPDPEQLAYTIFTSGSTGTPKGVEITHRAAANTVEDVNERWEVGPGDRVLAVSALDFDLSVYDIFGLLGAGGALVTIAEEERRDAQRWAELCTRHQVTVWNTVPALLDMLLVVTEHSPRSAPAGLRLALLSGDWIGLDLPGRLAEAAPNCTLIALGGATEAAIWSNAHQVTGLDPAWPSVPYGHPLRNQRYRVVDPASGADRPDWVPGELWIGGAGLARGYRGQPELTAERFITDRGQRWYRTGDMGRYRPGGPLEFLGRADNQVKLRGHRIELGEIEAALATHPSVAQAAVTLHGQGAERELAAAIVPRTVADKACLTVDKLGGWLAERLPTAMVPRHISPVDQLPLTANGKVDRAALASAVLAATPEADAVHDDPPLAKGPEQELASLWESVLGTSVTGRDANFFALGGDSIKAVRLVERAAAELDHVVPLARFFLRPTLGSFAAEGHGQTAEAEDNVEEGSL